MVTAALIAIAGILTYIGSRTTYYILKVLAGISWWGLGAWFVANPIGGDSSSPTQSIILLVVFFVGIACFFWAFYTSKYENGIEVRGRIRLPFMKSDEEEESDRLNRLLISRAQRVDRYMERLNSALNGERRRR